METNKNIEPQFEAGGTICPFLGMLEDPSTSLAYPSEWNVCHHSKPAAVPNLEHQRTHCLAESHSLCPVFTSQSPARLPNDIRIHLRKPRQNKNRFWLIGALVVGILGVGAVLAWTQFLSPGKPLSSLPLAASRTAAVNTSLPTQAEVESATPIPATFTPRPSITPLQDTETPSVSIHSLDMPIGVDHRFVIHRIQQGESLGQLATQYNTSFEAITLANFYLPAPVWINWLVIIPVDTKDMTGLPSFDAYMVVEGGLTIESLAANLNQDASDLEYYNGLEAGYLLSAGEWLLIPHARE
jgi:hypothetical protein